MAPSHPAPSDRIGFICAMPMELRPLARKLDLAKTHLGNLAVETGMLGSRELVATVSGMGTKLATEATERLLDATAIGRLVVVGITGAVDPDTPIGTLVLPEVVIDGATGAEHRPTPMGSGTPGGAMWTSDDLVGDPEVLGRLRDRGVVALDMETAAIADVCERRGVPWSVFRAVSDRATDGTIDEEVFGLSRQDGRPNGPAIARYVLRHPGRLPRMSRMAREAKLATNVAAAAAIAACHELATGGPGPGRR